MERMHRNVVAFLPLRGGSKSIPLKNVKLMAGKPLAVWVLESLQACREINKIFISTDSEHIKTILGDYVDRKTHIIGRSPESATDEACTEKALLEFAKQYEFDDVVFVQATSPLLYSEYLSDAIQKYYVSQADSLITLVRKHIFLWSQDGSCAKPINYDPKKRPRRQDWLGELVESGAFYIVKRRTLLTYRCRVGQKVLPYVLPKEMGYEVDNELDWIIVENIILARHKHNFCKIKNKVRLIITDVDGVLTDGVTYYSSAGEALKKFNMKDGMAVQLIRQQGIDVMMITGENSTIVEKRAKKLKIQKLYMGIKDKLTCVRGVLLKEKIQWGEVIYIGDDLNDLKIMRRVKLSVCPINAVLDIKRVATYIADAKGGEGVLRWVVNNLLESVYESVSLESANNY